jgi:hypothetical protein
MGVIGNEEKIWYYEFLKSVWVQFGNAREARLKIRNQA